MGNTVTTDSVVRERILYKDLYFRLLVCLIASHILVMIGQKFSTLHAFTIPSYYPTLFINYAIALLIAYAVRKVTIRLDSRYCWEQDILKRALLQFLLGVIAISLFSFFLVFLYFRAFSRNIMESRYPEFEFPFSVVLILCLNFYYVAYYFAVKYKRLHQKEIEPKETIPCKSKEIIVVDLASKSVPIRTSEIMGVFLLEGTVFIWLSGMKNLGECYAISVALSRIEEQLDERQFFRINRRCLVNFNIIRSFSQQSTKTLQLHLAPDIEALFEQKKELVAKLCQVSTDRVPLFKKWMDR